MSESRDAPDGLSCKACRYPVKQPHLSTLDAIALFFHETISPNAGGRQIGKPRSLKIISTPDGGETKDQKMKCALRWTGALLLLTIAASTVSAQAPLTVAESSGYKATSKHAEVVEYCERLAKLAPLVRLAELGVTTEGRKLPLVILADPPIAAPEEAVRSGKLIVFAMGNIHAGEVDGKEALLMLMRDLALARDKPLLKDLVLLFVPNFNADGGDRMDKNRPWQNGPTDVGIRPNAQGFDLNRDYIKLESPEVRALVRFFTRWDPAIIIDMHTTNGSHHNHTITYDSPRHPAFDARLVEFGHELMLPAVGKMLTKRSGYLTNYYGNFDKKKTIWEAAPALPRYGTQYVGFRHRIGILCESYVYASYRDRVLASRDFALSCFEYAAQNKQQLRKLLSDAEANAGKGKLALRGKEAPLKNITVIGVEGGKIAPPGTTKEYVVAYLGKCVATESVECPFAYLMPASYTKVRENLARHGIVVEELTADVELTVEVYRIDRIITAAKEFQNHKLVTVETTPRRMKQNVKTGTILVRCAQPLGTLAAYLLEPQSEDGLCAWNFFDEDLMQGADFPVLRLPAAVPLATRPAR
jgi:dipeptidyl-peptidase 4